MKTSQKRKKLLMTASVYVHIQNFHLPYLRQFQQLGWETHVGCAGIAPDAPHVDRAIDLPFKKQMGAPDNFRAARAIRRLAQAERYDLVIAHTTLASFFTRLAFKGLDRQTRLVNTMHGYLFDDDTPFVKRRILLDAEKLTAPETDLLLVMNEWDYRAAKRHHLAGRIEKIPGMGVDFSGLDRATGEDGRRLRGKLGIAGDAFVLLYAAEFSGRKSQAVLIRAMRALPADALLVLCGDGATLEECRGLARSLGVSGRVLFPGRVADMPCWYKMADACVSSSRSEGLPFNVIEGMRAGLPVIASDVKGHSDLVDHGVNGLLYPYGNETALAECVRRLMADAGLRAEMGRRARQSTERYSLENVLPEVMDRYLSALD